MLDARLRRIIDPTLDRLAGHLASRGLSADQTTLTGFAVGMMAVLMIAIGQYGAGLGLILLNRLLDGLDGAIARHTRLTDLGGFLDIALDFIFYASVPFAFALADPERNALPAAFLILSFVGTGTSFLAFAIMAAKRGLTSDLRGRKSLYYLGGLTEGTETLLAFALACLIPTWFPVIALVFGGLCWLTTATRFLVARAELAD